MSKPKPTSFRPPKIDFLGEQDGIPERELKIEIAKVLEEQPTVMRAYLAIVRYGASSPSVALCLADKTLHIEKIVLRIGQIFQKMFNVDECLEIFIINPSQERKLMKVCKPFFSRDDVSTGG